MRDDERDRVLLEKLEALILARLSVRGVRPPTRGQVAKALQGMLARRFTPAEFRERYDAALAGLIAARLVRAQPLELTAGGQARLLAALGLARRPRAATWREFKTKYLPRLFSPAMRGRRAPHDLRLALLAERLGVPTPAAPKPAGSRRAGAAIDRRAWGPLIEAWLQREIGLAGKLELDAVIAALLGRELGLRPGQKLDAVLRQAVLLLSGATQHDAEAVGDALALRWLCGEQTRERARVAPKARALGSNARALNGRARDGRPLDGRPLDGRIDPEFLARAAAKIARVADGPRVHAFGPNKVFIGSVWESLASDPELRSLGEDGFKALLVEAHRRGLVALSRADLIAAMDPRDVATSETRHDNATYHFIVRGASA